MKRLAVFAHYDKQNVVDDYIYYYLEHLKKVSSSIIFVTTSSIAEGDILKLKRICDSVIIRENFGYDFMSWKAGIEAIANLADCDELVICNDSVYGPIYPLEYVFNVMYCKDCDFWGITDSYEITYHLQSYFLVFKKRVIDSDIFKKFWNSVQIEETVDDVINKYEAGLTQVLIQAGFKPDAYVAYSFSKAKIIKARAKSAIKRPLQALRTIISKKGQIDLLAVNPSQHFWYELVVKQKVPFIKVKLLRDNPTLVNINKYKVILSQYSEYEPELIQKHLRRIKQD